MKAAISADQNNMNAKVSPRFGRCDYLLIVDTDDMGFEVLTNENKRLGGGAGIQTASLVISRGVDCVLTGECGPNAMGVFRAANVDVYIGQSGSVTEAVNRLKQGSLKPAAGAGAGETGDAPGPSASFDRPAQGTGGGSGRRMGGGGRGMGGRGCGGGRGMGQGRGMGGGYGMGRRG